MTLTYGTSVGGWRELLAERVQRVPIPALLKQTNARCEGSRGGLEACARLPVRLCLQGSREEVNRGGWKDWAFRASCVSTVGLVHCPKQAYTTNFPLLH